MLQLTLKDMNWMNKTKKQQLKFWLYSACKRLCEKRWEYLTDEFLFVLYFQPMEGCKWKHF